MVFLRSSNGKVLGSLPGNRVSRVYLCSQLVGKGGVRAEAGVVVSSIWQNIVDLFLPQICIPGHMKAAGMLDGKIYRSSVDVPE
jgi:hypothetical protein